MSRNSQKERRMGKKLLIYCKRITKSGGMKEKGRGEIKKHYLNGTEWGKTERTRQYSIGEDITVLQRGDWRFVSTAGTIYVCIHRLKGLSHQMEGVCCYTDSYIFQKLSFNAISYEKKT